jgi:hypothetical protein
MPTIPQVHRGGRNSWISCGFRDIGIETVHGLDHVAALLIAAS